MRFLGLLFLLLLILAGVGYCRGWFTVTTTHAGGRDRVTVGVDEDRIGADARAAANKIGELSAAAVEKLRGLGEKVDPDTRVVEGSVAAVDQAARDIEVTAGAERIRLHVPLGVAITKDGQAVDFDRLRPGTAVRLVLDEDPEHLRLERIELRS